MTNNIIQLIDIHNGKARDYDYTSSETIGDLQRNIAQKEGYDSQDKLKIILAFIPLPRDLYIKDIIDLEEHGFFIEFPDYPIVTSNRDIYVWAGKYNCKKLYGGVQESIHVKMNGHFGVARNRFAIRNIFTCHRQLTLYCI